MLKVVQFPVGIVTVADLAKLVSARVSAIIKATWSCGNMDVTIRSELSFERALKIVEELDLDVDLQLARIDWAEWGPPHVLPERESQPTFKGQVWAARWSADPGCFRVWRVTHDERKPEILAGMDAYLGTPSTQNAVLIQDVGQAHPLPPKVAFQVTKIMLNVVTGRTSSREPNVSQLPRPESRKHDFSDPYVTLGTARLCVACGHGMPTAFWNDKPCVPDPTWRVTQESMIHELMLKLK